MIDQQSLILAFSAGMLATVNPCGFAMLPAYLSYFLGTDDSPDARADVLRALRVGLAVTLGFVAVFLVMGVVFSAFTQSIGQYLPWLTIIVGIVLVVLGVALLRGYEPTVSLPKLQRGTNSRELPSMFLFGVSYAVSSLACSIPVFTALVATTFHQETLSAGVATFLAYALGMALVLMALTLALALARQGLVRSIRRVLPYVNRIAGVLVIIAGAYLVYYGWYELQVTGRGQDPGGPAGIAFRLNSDITTWVNSYDTRRIGIVLGAIVIVALLLALGRRRTAGSGQPNPHSHEPHSREPDSREPVSREPTSM